MYQINRGVIVIKRKQPFVDWVNSTNVPGDNNITSLADVNDEPGIYLIPEYEDSRSLKRLMPSAIDCIWECELMAWYTDETKWPKDQSAKAFHEWFEVEVGSIVYDLPDDPIDKEEA